MKNIQMFNRISGLATLYPPVMGDKHLPEWVDKTRQKYNKLTSTEKNEKTNILKCPGIFDLFSKGFYVPLPYEASFIVERGKQLLYRLPPFNSGKYTLFDETKTNPNDLIIDPMKHSMLTSEIAFQDLPRRSTSYEDIVNLKTGWTIISDVPLLLMPLPYPDQYEWEIGCGILDSKKNDELNAQIMFNNIKEYQSKEYIINAGEYIMFVVPLTHEQWNLDAREITEKDKSWLQLMHTMKKTWEYTMDRTKEWFSFNGCPLDLKKRKFKAFDKFWSK